MCEALASSETESGSVGASAGGGGRGVLDESRVSVLQDGKALAAAGCSHIHVTTSCPELCAKNG